MDYLPYLFLKTLLKIYQILSRKIVSAMKMSYKVLRIDEDISYGCEERTEDSPVMAIVTLQDENHSEKEICVPDQFLYDHDINEGDQVIIGENGGLQKLKV